MRIALAFPNIHRRGGVERVAFECARFLAGRGHEIELLASQCDPALKHDRIHWHPISAGGFGWWQITHFAGKAASACARIRPAPDVIGSFGVQSPPGSVTWVQSVHRAWIEISRQQRSFSGRLKQRINPFHAAALAMEKAYYGGRRYRKLIALTETVKNDLTRFYNIPPRDIEVLPNGFSSEEFDVPQTAKRQALRSRLGFNEADRVIIFVANELERKGFSPLLEAIGQLNDPAIKLLVVGRVNPAAYQARIDQLGANRVRFVGPTSNVADYYAAADLFALPTTYEAWGLVIVEALACGLRVLTSRLAGASVAVEEGRTGFLLDDPRDATEIAAKISRLFSSDAPPARQIADSVAAYSWDRILPRYEHILHQCAGENPAAVATACTGAAAH